MQLQGFYDNDFVMADVLGPDVLKAWERLLRSRQYFVARVEEELRLADLPPLEWYDVLWELEQADGEWLRQADVSRRVLIAPYNLSRLIDRLEQDGLVARRQCPKDGRNNVLVLTDKGRDLRRRIWPVYAAALDRHFGSRLSAAEARELALLLGRLDPVDGSGPR